jgi:hypothetical protein
MARDYKEETERERDARDAIKRWIQARVEAIRKAVSAHDVLRRNGIKLRHSTDREEQFSCPFHGIDRHPSARIYPESTKGPSHVWCFTCHENWDCIALWKKFSGSEVRFGQTLAEIERAFGLIPPERPPSAAEMAETEDPEAIEVELLFGACEDRLRWGKSAFDLRSHLVLGSILDRARYQFEGGRLSAPKVKALLQQVLDKIGAKVRDQHRES